MKKFLKTAFKSSLKAAQKTALKTVTLLVAVAMLCSIAACGAKNQDSATTAAADTAAATTAAANVAATTAAANTAATTAAVDTAATTAAVKVDKTDVVDKIGIVLPTRDEPRWLQDEAKFKEVISAAGFNAEILFSQGDSGAEKSNVETLLTMGVKVLIICPHDSKAAGAAVEEARAQGVTVISYDRLITDTDAVDYYVTFDSIDVGKKQGGYLADNASGSGNPLYLYAGAVSDHNAFLFFQGAWQMLQPKIADGTFTIMNSSEASALAGKAELTSDEQARIISQITTNWDFDVAKKRAEDNIVANPPPAGKSIYLLAPNDGTARAIADAFAAENARYFVTGQDAEKPSVQYIIDGKQSMTVFKDTRTLAGDAVNMAVSIITGAAVDAPGSYNNDKIDVKAKQTDVVVVTKDNVQPALIASGYYTAGDFTFPAAGAQAPVADVGGKIGIVLPTRDEPRWLQDEAKFKEVIAGAGYDAEILFSQGDSGTEKSNVETLLTMGVKVLIICPQDGKAAGAAVEEARAQGVTVISYDRLITDTDAVDYYVTFDSIDVGKKQGGYLADNASGSGNPLYLYAGAVSDHNAFLFFQGAWQMLQPKIADGTFTIMNSSEASALAGKAELTSDEQARIISQITTNWDFDVAKKRAEDNIVANPPPAGKSIYLLAPNDGTARAIADAFAAENARYFVTGQDAEKPSVQYIIDGKQSMTVFKDTRTLAGDAVNMAVSILRGAAVDAPGSYNNGKIDVKAKQTDVVVVTKDNVQSALIASGYYTASDFTGLN